jgi:hypothetical protein
LTNSRGNPDGRLAAMGAIFSAAIAGWDASELTAAAGVQLFHEHLSVVVVDTLDETLRGELPGGSGVVMPKMAIVGTA